MIMNRMAIHSMLGALKAADRAVARRETAGGDGGHAMGRRFERWHAGHPVERCADEGHHQVDHADGNPAIWAARGRIFSDRSELSVRTSCMPPTDRMGKMATPMTMMPMPPSHCRIARQSKDAGRSVVEADDHGRSGGGDTGHRLEDRIGEDRAPARRTSGEARRRS